VLAARRQLAQAPQPDDDRMRAFRRVLDTALVVADPELPTDKRRDAVNAYEEALAASPKRIHTIGSSVEQLKLWARGSDAIGARMAINGVVAGTARGLEMALMFD
jgi:hypothetical protein